MRRLSETFVDNLAEIHEIDYEAAGLGDLGSPQGYVKRQVEGWTKRYYNARTDDVPSIEKLAEWLHQNLPADSERPALIHNDYKYDNLVLAPDDLARVIAVLDWEMATIGDPLMDFGTSLGYWVEPTDPEEWQRYGFGLTSLAGSFTRTELLEHYARRTGRRIDDPVFYFAYGLLKIAVIVQQIYFRYQKGLTRDPRFAQLGALVKACGDLAERAIERKRIDALDWSFTQRRKDRKGAKAAQALTRLCVFAIFAPLRENYFTNSCVPNLNRNSATDIARFPHHSRNA